MLLLGVTMQSVTILSVTFSDYYADCCYDEWRYADVIMLSVVAPFYILHKNNALRLLVSIFCHCPKHDC
jgi:hypothetical protein